MRGELVAFPTETVYGLGADATSTRAVRKVFAAKGRPSNNPLIVHVASVAQAKQVVSAWPIEATRLARAFWPGPLTMVLPKARRISMLATAGQQSVGVRMPDHATALALIRRADRPLVGPSANVSGRVSPTCAEHVRAEFDEKLVMVLDGGACEVGIESTVVSLLDVVRGTGPARVLRPGVISSDEIEAALGTTRGAGAGLARNAVTQTNTTKKESARDKKRGRVLLSPGLLDKHYAPAVPMVLVASKAKANALLRGKAGPTLVVAQGTATGLALRAGDGFAAMPRDARGYAKKLYGVLHDTAWFARLVVVAPTKRARDAGVWEAIGDRLRRAAG